jgi:hypothetical protein
MTFRIHGLPRAVFAPLFTLSDEALTARRVIRMTVDAAPGFPCRVGLRDLEPGETVLLINHAHQPADTPYRSTHAIFVGEASTDAAPEPGEVPEVMARRSLSIRSFDATGMMLDAGLVEGRQAAPLITRLLEDARADCVHIHNAVRGCFAGYAVRA